MAVSQPTSFVVPADGYSDNVTVFVNLNIFPVRQSHRSGTDQLKGVRGTILPVMLMEDQPVTESLHVN